MVRNYAGAAFLSLFSSLTGMVMAFCAMWGLASIQIDAGDSPMGMLLVDGKLFFAPTFFAVIGIIVIVVMIAVMVSFFPALRASKLPAANAMRHYE
jgi:ABC-type lipoprotein release transport system permease subunit